MEEVIIDWTTARRRKDCQGYIGLHKTINYIHYFMFEHVYIWESVNGTKPKGFIIHHIDGTRDNNLIENLLCIDRLTHQRVHAGWEMREGEWWRLCHRCGEHKLATMSNFYKEQKCCKLCQLKYQTAYYLAHKEEISAKKKARYSVHKEEVVAKA